MSDENGLIDSFGRRITYFRISLTELCNFRCVYCLPRERVPFSNPSSYLTRHEIRRFVELAGRLGVTRFRLTGGEPLLRPDILEIVRTLKQVKTVHDLSITTNGSHLVSLARPLKEAGLDRMNISLDSLEPTRFEQITLSRSYDDVRRGIAMALKIGFPVKLNAVVMKGMAPSEMIEFVRLAYDGPLDVRFLEFMPLCGSSWQGDQVIPIAQVRSIIQENFILESEPRGNEVAETYVLSGGRGRVGFIGSLSESFCDSCTRMRLTADGKIKPCLFSHEEVPVSQLLKNGASDKAILEAIHYAAQIKPRGNPFYESPFRAGEDEDFFIANREAPLIRMIGG